LGQSNEDPNDDEEKLVGQQSDSMSYIYIYQKICVFLSWKYMKCTPFNMNRSYAFAIFFTYLINEHVLSFCSCFLWKYFQQIMCHYTLMNTSHITHIMPLFRIMEQLDVAKRKKHIVVFQLKN
jgi:hypothetical protein